MQFWRAPMHYLVPHEGNWHRPRILERDALAALLLVAIIGQVMVLTRYRAFTGGALIGDIAVTALVAQSNAERAELGLAALTPHAALQMAAQRKADDMAKKGYFAHQSPDGSQPWDWIANAGYRYKNAGENLAVNFVDSADVTAAWMASPGHRANILNGSYTEVGIATAEGIYKGKPATFVVEMFGTPVTAAPAVKEPVPEPIAEEKAEQTRVIKLLPKAKVAAPAASTTTPATTTTSTVAASSLAPIQVAHAQEPELGPVDAAAASPKKPLYALYLIIGILVSTGVLLKLVIRPRIAHAGLVVNGILAVMALAALAWITQYLTLFGATIG